VVCAGGLYVLELFGWITTSQVFIPTTYLWATLLGGVLIGAGIVVSTLGSALSLRRFLRV